MDRVGSRLPLQGRCACLRLDLDRSIFTWCAAVSDVWSFTKTLPFVGVVRCFSTIPVFLSCFCSFFFFSSLIVMPSGTRSTPQESMAEQDTHTTVVYTPREVNIDTFYGDGGVAETRRFIESVQRAWEDLRLQSDKEKVNLIYGKIGEEVEAELDCQLEVRIPSPQEVLKILERCYGEKRSVPALQRLFFSNKQRRGEDIRTYSHRIKAAFDAVVKKQQDTSATVSQPCELRDTFLENIRDRQMKRQLRQMLSNSPNSSFNELRIQSHALGRGGQRGGRRKANSASLRFSCDRHHRERD